MALPFLATLMGLGKTAAAGAGKAAMGAGKAAYGAAKPMLFAGAEKNDGGLPPLPLPMPGDEAPQVNPWAQMLRDAMVARAGRTKVDMPQMMPQSPQIMMPSFSQPPSLYGPPPNGGY